VRDKKHTTIKLLEFCSQPISQEKEGNKEFKKKKDPTFLQKKYST
jgi:hypothetical protein